MPEERETGIPRQGTQGRPAAGSSAPPPAAPPAGEGASVALPPRWRDVVAHLHPVFQPIVQMRTARVHGHEALLRGWEAAGFASLVALFQAAEDEGALLALEAHIQAAAVAAFLAAGGTAEVRLFLNIHPLAQGQVPPAAAGNNCTWSTRRREQPPSQPAPAVTVVTGGAGSTSPLTASAWAWRISSACWPARPVM
ncbi:EAL domain-containing protein [Nitrospirillum sp. BR 11163]|uniref:EAL domain-containing protein n=1 Tax=Nitrospirillum sp. BR 11163 TaxID=3104323 RepID=UPI002AFF6DEE|nr:EAL domain-containing protein [Nitrospirillum sp. BR 11163]MEA1672334.1 EAL domain-containing protein [Nitrospirillum sp. BR 11163]